MQFAGATVNGGVETVGGVTDTQSVCNRNQKYHQKYSD